MNEAGGPAWSAAEHFDPMSAASEQDFNQLIDFDNLDLSFNIDYTDPSAHDTGQQLGDLADSLHVQHLHNPFSPNVAQSHRHGRAGGPQPGPDDHSIPQPGNGLFDFSMPPSYNRINAPVFSQPAEQMYRPHAVPPTPNSIEMHGDPTRYMHHMDPQQAMFDQRYQLRKVETFTPLVSPAVTPHEVRFQIPDMTTVPGAYFSPLNSPALNAQNHQQAHAHTSQYTTSGSSTGASPVDVDMDLPGESALAQPEQGRRLRSTNKRAAPRSSTAATRVRHSPNVNPRRRKATVSSLIPPKEVTGLMEEARAIRPTSSGLDVGCSREGSETDSISPEPLSEMRPPPRPTSMSQSPAMLAQSKQASNQGVTPATPASLMRIGPSPTFGGAPDVPPTLDDFTLPEASLEKHPFPRSDTTIHEDEYDTPRLSARKTPKLNPLSTPSGSAAQSGKPSPMISAVSSPTSPAFAMGKRGDPKPIRNSKKRNSVSSTLVSPALRPKISPSIKPLLPEGAQGVSDDTHALLLASKSNYQNILDGTTVPGVVYPTSLSTNLTSKRTSHKIAEQGRRNRINTALIEMQALLPSPHLGTKEQKSPETTAQSNNSKAAKVESAIEYIKELKQQCSEKDRLLNQKDLEMEALRKEIAALKGGVQASDATTPDTDSKDSGT